MSVIDPFSYEARWDSIGLDCSTCKYFKGPEKWPDTQKELRCLKHGISLDFELGDKCYKINEWFCKYYSVNNNGCFPAALVQLETIRQTLEENIIYSGRYGKTLFEHKFK